jgi:Zn ribbon nucleic-acid-binding protein
MTLTVACPRCRRLEITALAVEGELQRFQCRSCGENFTGPRLPLGSSPEGSQQRVESPPSPALPGFSHVPIAPPDFSDPAVGDVLPAGKCSKCGKPYYRLGKKFEEHVASCDGKPWIPVVPRKRASRAGAHGGAGGGGGVQSAADPLFTTPAQRAVMPQGTGKALDVSIQALKVQRSVLEAEIAELDRTIMTLEKLRGLGGEPSVPFTPPAEEGSAESAPTPPPAEQPTVSETSSAPAGT